MPVLTARARRLTHPVVLPSLTIARGRLSHRAKHATGGTTVLGRARGQRRNQPRDSIYANQPHCQAMRRRRESAFRRGSPGISIALGNTIVEGVACCDVELRGNARGGKREAAPERGAAAIFRYRASGRAHWPRRHVQLVG